MISKAAGEENRRFLSSFRTNSLANLSSVVVAFLARNAAYS